jgi:hypothetical protein
LLKKPERLRSAPVPVLPDGALAEVMSNMCTQPLAPSAMRTLIQAPWRSPRRVTERLHRQRRQAAGRIARGVAQLRTRLISTASPCGWACAAALKASKGQQGQADNHPRLKCWIYSVSSAALPRVVIKELLWIWVLQANGRWCAARARVWAWAARRRWCAKACTC